MDVMAASDRRAQRLRKDNEVNCHSKLVEQTSTTPLLHLRLSRLGLKFSE
jgi:hypothetical protein